MGRVTWTASWRNRFLDFSGYNKVLHFCVAFTNKDFFSITCFLLSHSLYYTNTNSLHTWDMLWAVSLAARAPHFRPVSGGCGGEAAGSWNVIPTALSSLGAEDNSSRVKGKWHIFSSK